MTPANKNRLYRPGYDYARHRSKAMGAREAAKTNLVSNFYAPIDLIGSRLTMDTLIGSSGREL